MRLILLCIICFALKSCGDSSETQALGKANNSKIDPINAKRIERLNYTDYVLSAKAEEKLADWEKYQELAIQINYLKKADLTFFNGDKGPLKEFISAFKAGLPEDLKTNPILSRMAVIETTILRLNENLTLDNISNDLKLESIKEVLMSFSNLNFQVNKKIARDIYDQIKSDY
ncbi:hypothetical protein [uncultured Winogradskyella sp.]|uniref:hypothetical protein n=1 Tax=uncultured Winogradskyella sp. TaxID=395353 RepID=UPI002615F808|nr:hypothetical protein [uncultured Winogradskyella sp.]